MINKLKSLKVAKDKKLANGSVNGDVDGCVDGGMVIQMGGLCGL